MEKETQTLVVDRMGALHVWYGDVDPVQISKYEFRPQSDIYIQNSQDVCDYLDSLTLTSDQRIDLDNGWTVCTGETNND